MKLVCLALFAALGLSMSAARMEAPQVTLIRAPEGGIQPQAVEADGVVHLIYFSGDPAHGDLYYVRSMDFGRTFSKPIRVNQRPGASIAIGNIRGAQLAVGRNGRVHVAWNGAVADPRRSPMLYTRLNQAGTAFEPERNLIHSAWGIDGGGTVAADAKGDVYVLWHAPIPGRKGEENRRVWIARSKDDGATFAPETLAFSQPTGACGCCGMRAYADPSGDLYALFRSATNVVNRDIWLLDSRNEGRSFEGKDISQWKIGACVMSSESLGPSPDGVLAAWESEKQVYFTHIRPDTTEIAAPIAAPGSAENRKYPVAVSNSRGETLFAWTEGMAWKRGGAVEWQVYDREGHPESANGKADGVPAWSVITAFARRDGSFVIAY